MEIEMEPATFVEFLMYMAEVKGQMGVILAVLATKRLPNGNFAVPFPAEMADEVRHAREADGQTVQ